MPCGAKHRPAFHANASLFFNLSRVGSADVEFPRSSRARPLKGVCICCQSAPGALAFPGITTSTALQLAPMSRQRGSCSSASAVRVVQGDRYVSRHWPGLRDRRRATADEWLGSQANFRPVSSASASSFSLEKNSSFEKKKPRDGHITGLLKAIEGVAPENVSQVMNNWMLAGFRIGTNCYRPALAADLRAMTVLSRKSSPLHAAIAPRSTARQKSRHPRQQNRGRFDAAKEDDHCSGAEKLAPAVSEPAY